MGGLLGVGGGLVMVPLQVIWGGLTQRQANATSLVAIIPIAIAALPIYYFQKGTPQVDLHVALFLVTRQRCRRLRRRAAAETDP